MNQAKPIKLGLHLFLSSIQRVVLLTVLVVPSILPAAVYATTTPAKIIYMPSRGAGLEVGTLRAACIVQMTPFCDGVIAINCRLMTTDAHPLNLRSGVCYFTYFDTRLPDPGTHPQVVGTGLPPIS